MTAGVVAAVGAGYLAYLKWRSPRPRAVGPATSGAVLGALQDDGQEGLQMQTVYEGVPRTQYEIVEQQYEQPHIDTWAETYDTGHQGIRTAENAVRLRSNTQWDPRDYETNTQRPFYETIAPDDQTSQLQPGYDITNPAPKIYLDDSTDYPTYERVDGFPTQDPWNLEDA